MRPHEPPDEERNRDDDRGGDPRTPDRVRLAARRGNSSQLFPERAQVSLGPLQLFGKRLSVGRLAGRRLRHVVNTRPSYLTENIGGQIGSEARVQVIAADRDVMRQQQNDDDQQAEQNQDSARREGA
jgi:hypothetical protein